MAECPKCHHDAHEPGKCATLFVYDRPGGPPGNQQCLCGVSAEIFSSQHPPFRVRKFELTDDDRARARFSITELEFIPDPEEQAEFLAGEFARCRIAHTIRQGLSTLPLDRIEQSNVLSEFGIWPMVLGVREGLRRFFKRHG